MEENDIGKEVVDAAVKKRGITRMVMGLPEENLGVSASLREPKQNGQQGACTQPSLA